MARHEYAPTNVPTNQPVYIITTAPVAAPLYDRSLAGASIGVARSPPQAPPPYEEAHEYPTAFVNYTLPPRRMSFFRSRQPQTQTSRHFMLNGSSSCWARHKRPIAYAILLGVFVLPVLVFFIVMLTMT